MAELVTSGPSSGVVGYDSADWTGGTPRFDRVHSAFGISTILQCGGDLRDPVMEADVACCDIAVALFKVGRPARSDRRIAGKSARRMQQPGEGSLLAPNTDSWWAVDRHNTDGWFHIHFAPELVREVEAVHNMRLETVPDAADSQMSALVSLVFDLVAHAEDPDPILWQSVGQVLLWRWLMLTAQKKRRDEARGGLAAWQAKRTTEYLAENIERRVSLDELAAIARLSPFHFTRAFSKTLGMPPYRYQLKLRMERACELLARSDLRIIDIALATGYESPQALARVFMRTYGMAPSQWRRRNAQR